MGSRCVSFKTGGRGRLGHCWGPSVTGESRLGGMHLKEGLTDARGEGLDGVCRKGREAKVRSTRGGVWAPAWRRLWKWEGFGGSWRVAAPGLLLANPDFEMPVERPGSGVETTGGCVGLGAGREPALPEF